MTGTNYADLIYSKNTNKIPDIDETINENPVSSLSQFLKLYDLKKNNDPGFERLARKTVLYFNNPAWLQFQLSYAMDDSDETLETSEKVSESGHFAVVFPEQIIKQKPVIEEASKTENYEAVAEIDEEEIQENNSSEEKIGEQIFDEREEEIPSLPPLEIEEPFSEENHQNNFVSDSETSSETELSSNENEVTEAFQNDDVEDIEFEEEPEQEKLVAEASDNSENEEVAFQRKEQILEENEIKNDAPSENESGAETAFQPVTVPSEEISKVEDPENESPTTDEVPFEPLHTVDYFASQGIKISADIMNDKLGKQMRSFTDWLKSMKKLHPGKLPEQNEVIEKIIQSSAEESNADAEVLTEAMAEVLIKQNKQEKAIEMYEKLSLMNPSKSAYFAAKIESLKTT
jgi:hypothetical protein